jgi:hypothetical protein
MNRGVGQSYTLYLRGDPEDLRLALAELNGAAKPADDGFDLGVARAKLGPQAAAVSVSFEANRDEVGVFFEQLAQAVVRYALEVDDVPGSPSAQTLVDRYDAWLVEMRKPPRHPGDQLTPSRPPSLVDGYGLGLVLALLALSAAFGGCVYALHKASSGIHF